MPNPNSNDRSPRQPRMGRSAWMWGVIILFVLGYLIMLGPEQTRRGLVAVYGVGLLQPVPLTVELEDVKRRLTMLTRPELEAMAVTVM